MAARQAKASKHGSAADTTAAVNEYMRTFAHPFTAEVEILRRAILAADPSISEGVKWNAPSYRTTEYFATTNLRAKIGIGLVLHLGATTRELPAGGIVVADPAKLLRWVGKDRALIEFQTSKEVEERIPALQAVLRDWIKFV
jgi:hypothetical protein